MAKDLDEQGAPEPGHNQPSDDELKDMIREVNATIAPIIAERAEAREKVSGYSKRINKEVRKLKEHGITAKRFWAIREVAELEDELEQTDAIDEIRKLAIALLPGQQASLFVSAYKDGG